MAGSASNVEIPSTIDGCKVTAIGNSAFEDCKMLHLLIVVI